MSTGTHSATTTQVRDRRRRGVVVLKFGLAGAALLGIAAAATSAAWSDNAWFSASATAATVDLQGSLDTTPLVWDPANTAAAALPIPPATFQNLVPNESRTYTVHVKNNGSTTVTVAAPVWTPSPTDNAIFAAPKGATVALAQTTPFTLAPGGTKDVVVTVTAGAWTDGADYTAYAGKTGAGTIVFSTTVGS